MKQLLLTCLIFLPGAFFAQVVIDSPEYHQMKASGQLAPATLTIPNPAIAGPPAGVQPNATTKANSCDCYVEPDATYTLAIQPNDDGYSDTIPIPFNFCMYGQTFNQIFINNNGNVTFTSGMGTYSATAFPSSGDGAIVAPFWGDVDTRPTFPSTVPNGEVLYKITPTAVYVNWKEVGYYSTRGELRNTFQLIITDGSDPVIESGNVAFCYKDMQWTTGGASGGVNGFGGVPATAGANKGDGVGYFLISRFDHPGNDFDGALGNPDGISWLDYKSFAFDACNVGNIPPIPDGVSSCDTFTICSIGDTADISINFLSPETNQSTSITYSNGGLTSLQQIANIPGNTGVLVLRAIGDPADVGYYNITVTATDNATPIAGVTTLSFVLHIDGFNATNLNPVITPLEGCDTVTLSVLNGPYDSYLWDDLTNGATTGLGVAQDFGVTVSLNGCYKRVHDFINIVEPFNINLQGQFAFCPPITQGDFFVPDSLYYDSISWSLANPAQDSVYSNTLGAGTYTIHLVDSFNLCTKDTTFTVSVQLPLVLEPDTSLCQLTFAFTGNTGGSATGTWSVLGTPAAMPVFSNQTLNPGVTFSAPGTYDLVYTENNCLDKDTIRIVVNTPPNFGFINDFFVCPGTLEYMFVSDSLGMGHIDWNTTNPPAIDTLYSINLAPGTYHVNLVDSAFLCPVDTTFTIVSQVPVVLQADSAICSPNFVFTSNTGGTGVGTWSVLNPGALPPAFANNNLNTSVTFFDYGIYNLVYSASTCQDKDTVQIIYGAPPTFNFTNDFFVCPGDLEHMFISDSVHMSDVSWGASNPALEGIYSGNLNVGTHTVTLTTEYGCVDDTTFTITTQDGVHIDQITQICGDTLEFSINTGIPVGQWTYYNSAGSVNFRDVTDLNTGLDVTAYGLYNLVFTEPTCNESDTLSVNFIPYPYVDVNESIDLCEGQLVEITANVINPEFITDSYWSTGALTSTITIGNPGYYYVTVENQCGSYTDSILAITKICDFNLPNVFTPDGTGANDTWKLLQVDDIFKAFTCTITNRWGNVVYEFNGPSDEWDGKDKAGNEVSAGVYFYNITFTTLGDQEFQKHGFIHLER